MPISSSKLQHVAFSTQFRYEQVSLKGHKDYSMGAGISYVTVTIPHNLGYRPFFRIWFRYPNSTRVYQMESGPSTYGLSGDFQIEDIGSTTTDVTVQIGNYGGTSGTGTIYYRIYEEPQ